MFNFKNKKMIMVQYGVMFAWLIASFVMARNTVLTPWSITLIFIGILVVTGFSLTRLFKIKFANDSLGQFVLWFASGLAFSLLLCFMAMMIGLTIKVLTDVFMILIPVLLVTALFFDLKRKTEVEKWSFDWTKIWQAQNIGYFLVFIVAIGVVISVMISGTLLRGGDTDFHMSILQKAVSQQPLTPSNLSFVKGDTIHIAYGLPVWHVFLGLLSTLTQTDHINMWKAICVPLSVMAFVIWGWLFQLIFQKKFFSWIGVAFVVIYIFNWNTGYLFTCLPLPDTLNNMLIFPLVTALTFKYIFEDSTNQKLLILVSVMAVLMAAIHLTQYLYYLVLLVAFGVIWLIMKRQEPDYKTVIQRIGWVLLGSFIIFVPFLIFLELKSHIITKVMAENIQNTTNLDPEQLRFGTFKDYDIYSKYAYLLTPITLALAIKNRKLVFIFALMLIAPIAYLEPVAVFLLKVLGYIFVNRLIGSITWHYLTLALVFGFMVLVLDKLISKLNLPKWGQYLGNVILVVIAGLMVKTQFHLALIPSAKDSTKTVLAPVATIYNQIFSDNTDIWLGKHFLTFFAPIVLLAIILIVLQLWKPKIIEFFNLDEPKNGIFSSFAIIALLVIFFSPTYQYLFTNFKNAYQKNIFLKPVDANGFRASTEKSIGGADMAEFIRKSLPPKSVFLTPGSTVYTFPIVLDQFMTAYPRTGVLNRYNLIYEDKHTFEERMIQVGKSKAEYIVLYNPANQGEEFFDAYPQYFKKIFKKTSVIYQVLPAAKIKADELAKN